MYQLQNGHFGQPAQVVKCLSDNAFIPFDPANTDYQEYLKWLAAGNQPIPADAGEGNAPYGADEPLPAETPE
jgi:hypothetical protein